MKVQSNPLTQVSYSCTVCVKQKTSFFIEPVKVAVPEAATNLPTKTFNIIPTFSQLCKQDHVNGCHKKELSLTNGHTTFTEWLSEYKTKA